MTRMKSLSHNQRKQSKRVNQGCQYKIWWWRNLLYSNWCTHQLFLYVLEYHWYCNRGYPCVHAPSVCLDVWICTKHILITCPLLLHSVCPTIKEESDHAKKEGMRQLLWYNLVLLLLIFTWMSTSAIDCSTITASLEDSMVCFLDHFSYPQHSFLLQDGDDPEIQTVFSSDTQIHACPQWLI